ncbi:MAG: ATP-binding protein [Candidatus Methanomethylophilaceae archaeon]|nr:ATP-binding protein [Candidatus Methanomethylophilaceae archaeon]
MTLEPEGYLPRLVEQDVAIALRTVGAVSIEGPKSCGKTWCARKFSNSEFSLVDPKDDFANFELASMDPSITLGGERPHLIDEWQDVPKIWDAVRYSVDLEGKKGSYILCGSSSVDKSQLKHSGAGRMMSVRMRPMSLLESEDSTGRASLRGIFDGILETSRVEASSIQDLAWLIVRGGWPGSLSLDEVSARAILRDYLDKACSVDAQKIDGRKRNIGGLMRTLRSLARNESTMASKSKISADIKEFEFESVDDETVSDYMDVFGRLYLRDDQPAFNPHRRSSSRVGKSPKRHFVDPSLAASAMNMGTKELSSDLRTMGFLFESLCVRDLRIYAEHIGGSIGHYRDHSGKEVDAVVEMPGGTWGAFEIKLGQNAVEEAANNLVKIRDSIRAKEPGTEPSVLCVITGTGGTTHRRDDGVFVVPITALGP